MSEPITYAKVHGPPDNWYGLEIIDLETGLKVSNVVKVDTAAGWVERLTGNVIYDEVDVTTAADEYRRFARGSATLERERLRGRFEIRRPGG